VMPHQLVGFLESTFIEQEIDPLARRELALLMLARTALLTSTGFSRGMAAA
jgi:hypothetical protein